MKNELHYLRHQLAQHRNFIEGLRKRATDYGSNFSEDVRTDCESFLRDQMPLKNSKHMVITRAFFQRISKRAIANMQLVRATKDAIAFLKRGNAEAHFDKSNPEDREALRQINHHLDAMGAAITAQEAAK